MTKPRDQGHRKAALRSLRPLVACIAGATLVLACSSPRTARQLPGNGATAAAPAPAPQTPLPLLGTDPELAVGSDLRALARWIGDASLVGLGEGYHGTHELHRLAHRIFAHLVEEEGFTVFALEVDQAHAALLDDFVAGKRGDLDAILAQRWWASEIFYDEALRELLLWMRERNARGGERLRFAGFDLKQPDLAAGALLRELAALDPAAVREAETLVASVRELGGFGIYPNVFGFSATLELPLPPGRHETRRLRIRLPVKSRGLEYHRPGFEVRAGDATNEARLARQQWNVAEWIALETEILIAPEVETADIVLFHRGNGTVWFAPLAATLNGTPLPVSPITELHADPLELPHLQVMDHTAAADPAVAVAGEPSLRISCDPRVDRARAAARRLSALVADRVTGSRLPAEKALWLRQLARLIEQATAWRTLEQNNRDVFLAENLEWVQRVGADSGRVLALAADSHTERLPQRMGSFLAQGYGDRYRTVSMLPVAGSAIGRHDWRSARHGGPFEVVAFGAEDASPLTRFLATLAPGDFLTRVAGSDLPTRAPSVDPSILPDVAILVRQVTAARVAPRSH